MGRPLVIVVSPYAGAVALNVAYARLAVRDSLIRGELPVAAHLLYTQHGVLDDDDPIERNMGCDAGLALIERADVVAAYVDLGVSPGMGREILAAEARGLVVERRTLPDWVHERSGAT